MSKKHRNFSDEVDYNHYFDLNIAKRSKRSENNRYGYYFSQLGKIAYFKAHFKKEDISKDAEIIKILNDSQLKEYFMKGYEMAEALVKNGFSKENYDAFIQNLPKIENGIHR